MLKLQKAPAEIYNILHKDYIGFGEAYDSDIDSWQYCVWCYSLCFITALSMHNQRQ